MDSYQQSPPIYEDYDPFTGMANQFPLPQFDPYAYVYPSPEQFYPSPAPSFEPASSSSPPPPKPTKKASVDRRTQKPKKNLPPIEITPDLDKAAAKKARNTQAARNSRGKKDHRLQELLEENERLKQERDEWRAKAEQLEFIAGTNLYPLTPEPSLQQQWGDGSVLGYGYGQP